MKFAILLVAFFLFLSQAFTAFAIEDPRNNPNNKMGVHILFAAELETASKLINSSGGDWGYATIPIQTGDKDIGKWQQFMNDAAKYHVIPIIRIATEGDYFNTSVWKKPQYDDILDFANFLNSLDWPVKNRYVIIFNEVNRSDEWGGDSDPAEYARALDYAVNVFKSFNEDFFIISAGMDNASSNDQYSYMIQMNQEVPNIFSKIDGLGSHSYPNPAFSVPPWVVTSKSISSFRFERDLAFDLSGKDLPVFITETGWSKDRVSENQITQYFKYAFENVWTDENIVAITPFLLQAGPGPFFQFSLINEDGSFNEISKTIQGLTKTKGTPTVDQVPTNIMTSAKKDIPIKMFPKKVQYENPTTQRVEAITPFLKWILRLSD